MEHRPSAPEVLVVRRAEQIEELCRLCREEGRFAFDTEFVMEDRFEPEVCLIQLATGARVAMVDPFLKLDISPVWELVCDPKVETVVHAGQEDLALAVQHTGNVPRNVYDLQLAAGFAGFEYPVSLQRLVQLMMHVRLHKAKTLTDWRKRPLTPSQIRYAAEDVCHLLPVRDKLHERLLKRGRVAWAREEFKKLEEPALYRRAEAEKLARLKGSGSLRGRQLAILRDLLAWREQVASRLNRPVRAVLKDHLLVEIARLQLRSFREIRDLRGLNLSDRHVRQLCGVVEKALSTPSTDWPVASPRETEPAAGAALIALVTAVARAASQEQAIAYGLVASKRSISELVRRVATDGDASSSESLELLSGWRKVAVGTLLYDVLRGRRMVHVDDAEGEPALRVVPTARGKSG